MENKLTYKQHTKKQKVIRALISIGLIIFFLLAIYLPLELTGTLKQIKSLDALKGLISSSSYSYVLFLVLQFIQVVFLPIPAIITTLAGVFVFGALEAFVLSLISVISGSIVAFFLGRKFGKKLLIWILGKEDALKWQDTMGKGKYMFFLMMLFPGFPDDVLCMVAGTTKMSFKFFLLTNMIVRPIVFAGICFFASGQIVPFSGWGVPVWIVGIIAMSMLLLLSVKYQKNIESFLSKIALKMKSFFKGDKQN